MKHKQIILGREEDQRILVQVSTRGASGSFEDLDGGFNFWIMYVVKTLE